MLTESMFKICRLLHDHYHPIYFVVSAGETRSAAREPKQCSRMAAASEPFILKTFGDHLVVQAVTYWHAHHGAQQRV
jgi:hypothetical protein